jgi:DNA-binding transcriptional ArsR family regulator
MKNNRAYEEGMKEALKMLKIMGHPLRLSILCRLIENGEMNAGDIVAAEQEKASQSQISQYLNALRKQGLIESRRDGHFLYYRISDKRVKEIMKTLHKLYCRT